jgi:DNA modification methylase
VNTYRIIEGEVVDCLKQIEDGTVQCCVTSPPYWGLRSYLDDDDPLKCMEIGTEKTPEEFVDRLVGVFREVKRVLRDDGVLFLNLGDSYATGGRGGGGSFMDERGASTWKGKTTANGWKSAPPGLKHKDLVGIPWMVAFALRADGWYLRSDIIWNKTNPMPESVTDRPTNSHEYIFLLTKGPRYFWDAAAVAEKSTQADGTARKQRARALEIAKEAGLSAEHFDAIRSAGNTDVGKSKITQSGSGKNTPDVQRLAAEAKEALGGYYREFLSDGTRNIRSVWAIATKPYRGAHFATFPPEIPERCIKAGSKTGDLVLDPFAGSGTTLSAAVRLGREAVGCDLDADAISQAHKRIEKEAGTMFVTRVDHLRAPE